MDRSELIMVVSLAASHFLAWALSLFCLYRSYHHLSAEGRQRFWTLMRWGSLVARRQDFTPTGWKYRVRALQVWLLPIAVFVVLFYVQVFVRRS